MGVLTGELHKIVFGGPLYGSESWACSLHMMTADAETEEDALALPLLLPPINDWFLRQGTQMSPGAKLAFIKSNRVDKVTGHYSDATDSNTLFLDPVINAPLTGHAPPQNTVALSWHTDIIRGRASHGRIFPPTASSNVGGTDLVGTDGRVTLPLTLGMADSAQELLAELNNATVNLTAVVWSQIGQTGRAIETVSCGRVTDTQRRRRRNLLEERVFAAAPV